MTTQSQHGQSDSMEITPEQLKAEVEAALAASKAVLEAPMPPPSPTLPLRASNPAGQTITVEQTETPIEPFDVVPPPVPQNTHINPALASYMGGGFNMMPSTEPEAVAVEVNVPRLSGLHPRLQLLLEENSQRESLEVPAVPPPSAPEEAPLTPEPRGEVPQEPPFSPAQPEVGGAATSVPLPETDEVGRWVDGIREWMGRTSWVQKHRRGVAAVGVARVSQMPPGAFEDITDRAEALLADESFVRSIVRFCFAWQRAWAVPSLARYVTEAAMHTATTAHALDEYGNENE